MILISGNGINNTQKENLEMMELWIKNRPTDGLE
jgi:hypothetical protein